MRTRLSRICAGAVVACAAFPAAAAADPTWLHDSVYEEQSAGYLQCVNATSSLDEVLPAVRYAETYLDPDDAPAVGEVQYARVAFYYGAFDGCLDVGGTRAQVEVIPPPGVEVVVSEEHPVLCGFWGQDAQQCPAAARPGEFGGTIVEDARGSAPLPWAVPSATERFRVIVGLRATRAYDSYTTSQEKFCGGPCQAAESNGRVQFAVRFIPGTGAQPSAPLLTSVGIKTGEGAPSGLIAKAPAKVRRRALRRGVSVRVDAPRGARVRVRLAARGRRIAAGRATAGGAGSVTVRLKAKGAALRRLGRRSRKATLKVTVTPQGEPPQSERRRLTIRR